MAPVSVTNPQIEHVHVIFLKENKQDMLSVLKFVPHLPLEPSLPLH